MEATLAVEPRDLHHAEHGQPQEDDDGPADPAEPDAVVDDEPSEHTGRGAQGGEHRGKAEDEQRRGEEHLGEVPAPLRELHLAQRHTGYEGQVSRDERDDARREKPEHACGERQHQGDILHERARVTVRTAAGAWTPIPPHLSGRSPL